MLGTHIVARMPHKWVQASHSQVSTRTVALARQAPVPRLRTEHAG